mmetsp:Transcript_13436/g.41581  ORF Transcript_13436/g.41581 Transcript_13436/m.41581 type:complete len:245 (+) Transcript_13436:519-1253(+)
MTSPRPISSTRSDGGKHAYSANVAFFRLRRRKRSDGITSFNDSSSEVFLNARKTFAALGYPPYSKPLSIEDPTQNSVGPCVLVRRSRSGDRTVTLNEPKSWPAMPCSASDCPPKTYWSSWCQCCAAAPGSENATPASLSVASSPRIRGCRSSCVSQGAATISGASNDGGKSASQRVPFSKDPSRLLNQNFSPCVVVPRSDTEPFRTATTCSARAARYSSMSARGNAFFTTSTRHFRKIRAAAGT